MEILFCDLCNESVPQSDLDLKRAFRLNGRVVCAECDKAMSSANRAEDAEERREAVELATRVPEPHPAAAPTPAYGSPTPAAARHAAAVAPPTHHGTHPAAAPAARSGGGVLLGLVAIVFSAGGFALIIDRTDQVAYRAEVGARALRSELHHIRREQTRLGDLIDTRLAESEERSGARLDEVRTELVAGLETIKSDVQDTQMRIIAHGDDLQSLSDKTGRNDLATKERVDALTQTVQRNEQELGVFRNVAIELQETMRNLARQPSPLAQAAGGADSGGGASATPAWNGLLSDLAHSNSGIRLEAIYALGETRDNGVLPYLIPMLKDDDLFVRMATARTLENFKAKTAVPSLIDALEDSESAVREAAMVALRAITDRDFRFEPLATPDARGKRVKAWRDWWKKSGESFLRGDG